MKLLFSLGVTPYGAPTTPHATPLLPVILDGRIIGEVESGLMQEFSVKLRTLKAMGKEKVFSLEQVQVVGVEERKREEGRREGEKEKGEGGKKEGNEKGW